MKDPSIGAVALRAAQCLRRLSAEVRELEACACRMLEEGYDRQGHRGFLIRRAEILAGLPETLAVELAGETNQLPAGIDAAVKAIAYDAERALAIGSVFYMSVLLCDADHREGDPDELQKLIVWLEQAGSGI